MQSVFARMSFAAGFRTDGSLGRYQIEGSVMESQRQLDCYRGVVYPAQCDAMGHMNVQYYVAAFDQAMWHLAHELQGEAQTTRKNLAGRMFVTSSIFARS